MSCRNPCRLYIHLAFAYYVSPSSGVRSKLGPTLPFPPMRLLEVQWSRALILVCKVALILLANPSCLYRTNDMIVVVRLLPTILASNVNINMNIYIYNNRAPQKGSYAKESLPK